MIEDSIKEYVLQGLYTQEVHEKVAQQFANWWLYYLK